MAPKSSLEIAADRLKAAAEDLDILSSLCEERIVKELLNHPQVGEGWRKWIEWRRKVLTSVAPPEAPPVPEEEPAAEKPVTEEAVAEAVTEGDQVSSEQAEEPELDILRLAEARKRAYDELIAAAKAAGVFIDPNEEIEVGGRTVRSITYLLSRIVSGETSEEAVKEAVALGWASSYLGVSPEAYNALLQAAQEAGLWILKRVFWSDGRELRPISELAKKIEAGYIAPAEAVELARRAGWTRPLRRSVGGEEAASNGGFATIGEQLNEKNNSLNQWLAEANRRKKEAEKAQQNAGGGKKKKK